MSGAEKSRDKEVRTAELRKKLIESKKLLEIFKSKIIDTQLLASNTYEKEKYGA